jgi:single-stranded-DNA-specific exonuclease
VRWVFPGAGVGDGAEERAVRRLATELGLEPLAARVLVNRGLGDPATAAAFLAHGLGELPDPFLMKGMDLAVERLTRAIVGGEKITLYGDYDVDGVCSTALLSLFLEAVGNSPTTYIPHRIEEGYGLNHRAVERIATDGTRVLVTLDCGIASVAEVTRARALGLDVVVVDHHAVPETLPPATAVLNPLQPGCAYPTRVLCAAGVAFNLMMALRRGLRAQGHFAHRPEPALKPFLDLVALATVADVVPLVGANRVLVKHGREVLGRAIRPGVQALNEVAVIAAGAPVRTGQVSSTPGRGSRRWRPRRHLTTQLLRALDRRGPSLAAEWMGAPPAASSRSAWWTSAGAAERPGVRGLVLSGDTWHPGVVGIVAARVVGASTPGAGRSSGRSGKEAPGHRGYAAGALQACAEHLSRWRAPPRRGSSGPAALIRRG